MNPQPASCNRHGQLAERERISLLADAPVRPRLTFDARPCLHWHTWQSGLMDIHVSLAGYPFAYMVVNDGVMDEETVHVDAQWSVRCDDGSASVCVHSALMLIAMETELRRLLRPEIIAGCRAVVARDCPTALAGGRGVRGKRPAKKRAVEVVIHGGGEDQ